MRTLTHVVAPEDDGRLFKRVVRARMSVSHRQFSDLKYGGGWSLDGAPALANCTVRAGQIISIELNDEQGGVAAPEDAPVNIRYMDEDLMVIDKSAPLACQSSPKQPENALENRLMHLFQDRAFVFRPVNRLDKGTSGLMVAAMHAHAQHLLQEQLHTPEFVREYLAVVVGGPSPEAGTVDAPIAKCAGATVRREVRSDGQSAMTHYRTLHAADGLSLVELRLSTGRTHQIRVHMAHIGCPVLGDFLYGSEDLRLPGRFALHSARVRFIHPITKQEMEFISALPAELGALMTGI